LFQEQKKEQANATAEDKRLEAKRARKEKKQKLKANAD
jgi:hypothetical protein